MSMLGLATLYFAMCVGSPLPANLIEVKTAKTKQLLEQGTALYEQSKFDEALATFKGAQRSTTVPAEQDLMVIWCARVHTAKGAVEDGRATLRLALKRPSPALAAELGRSLLMNQPTDVKEAIHLLLGAIKSYAKKAEEPWLVLGKAYIIDEQYQSAIQIYRLLIKDVNKKELRAYTGLADAFILTRQYKEAYDIIAAAEKLYPDDPEILFYIGRVKERDTRQRSPASLAASYYQAAAQLAKNSPRFAAAAMYAYLAAREPSSAIEAYNKQKNVTPGDSYVLWFEGLNRELGWKIPEAIALYQEAILKNPDNVYAHYVLARVYLGLGNKALRLSGIEPPESFRVTPFRDSTKGLQEVSIIKFLDPTFPQLGMLRGAYESALSRSDRFNNLTPEQKQSLSKMTSFIVKLNRYR